MSPPLCFSHVHTLAQTHCHYSHITWVSRILTSVFSCQGACMWVASRPVAQNCRSNSAETRKWEAYKQESKGTHSVIFIYFLVKFCLWNRKETEEVIVTGIKLLEFTVVAVFIKYKKFMIHATCKEVSESEQSYEKCMMCTKMQCHNWILPCYQLVIWEGTPSFLVKYPK